MKKLLLSAAMLTVCFAASAKVWRINYDSNAKADFRTIALCQAWNGYTAGDTLYMEPGVHRGSESDNYITKSCTILGPGWGFQSSTNTISEVESAIFTKVIKINTSGLTVKISGIVANGGFSGYETSSNLIIEKCYLYEIKYIQAYNLTIHSCYINGGLGYSPYANVTSGIITGNIIRGQLYLPTPSVRLVVDHNTICGSVSGESLQNMNTKTVFSNNIVINTSAYDKVNITAFLVASYSTYNNILSFRTSTIEDAEYKGDTTYGSLKNSTNKIDATVGNTFKCHIDNGIVDNAMYYYVKDDAVAKTGDSNGGECGAFGGDFPYQLNGRPDGVPYLYDIQVPTHTTDNQLNISFKVAGNNE